MRRLATQILRWLMLCSVAIGVAHAEQFPAKPVHIVLGFPPGSAPDVVTRIAAEGMAEELREAVLIDNRPGAGGTIATDAVARAPADGYTLMVSGCSADGIVYAYVMSNRQPFDPLKDFVPVGQVMRDQWLVAVAPSSGVRNVAELVAMAKASAEPLTYPSTGIGSSQHLQSERFARRLGLQANHVPYKDNPVPDLLAGRLSFVVNSAAALAPLVRSGKLTGIAVLSRERLASLPAVPSAPEAGIPDLLYTAGVCLYAPGNTPREVVSRLNLALNRTEANPSLATRFADLGVEPVQRSPDETAAFIRELMSMVDELRIAAFGKAR